MFFPSAHFIQWAETAASMFKTGQLCSDQLTVEAQLGQPNRQNSNCKQMRHTFGEGIQPGEMATVQFRASCCFSRDSCW